MTDDHQSVFQRPIPWAISFVFGSAVVGPLLFLPPWGDQFRRYQQASLAIGLVAWSATAALVLAYI